MLDAITDFIGDFSAEIVLFLGIVVAFIFCTYPIWAQSPASIVEDGQNYGRACIYSEKYTSTCCRNYCLSSNSNQTCTIACLEVLVEE